MKIKKHIRNTILILLILLLPTISMLPMHASSRRVIKVGYPIQSGLTMKDENGNRYGYTYDYLMQIAQYNDWEYEFVEAKGDLNEQLTTLTKQLEDGEIDLLGCMRYNDALAKMYDYPSEPYGYAYNIIAVKDDSDLVNLESLATKKDLKIAVNKNAKTRIEKLDQFAAMNGFTYTKIEALDTEDLIKKIENEEADAYLLTDLENTEDYRSISRFSPDAFYFATTKGNTEIVTELNQAILDLSKMNPLLTTTLYNRYFENMCGEIHLNSKEKEFIKENGTIKVLVLENNAPIEDSKNGEAVGIGKDILDFISENTGMKFEYEMVKTYEEYKNKIKNREASVLMGLPFDASQAETLDVTFTSPWLVSDIMLVMNKNLDPNELKDKIKGTTYLNTPAIAEANEDKRYNNIEDLLEALNEREVDYAYINPYQLTYYTNKLHLDNLSTFSVPEYLLNQYAFGVSKNTDSRLISILNKGIRTIDSEKLNRYIYKNAYVEESFHLKDFLNEHIAGVSFVALLLIAGIVGAIFMYYRHRFEVQRAIELEYQRYQMLSIITGEMNFEYDFEKDTMKISKEGIGKIANEEMIEHFKDESAKQETNEHMVLTVLEEYLENALDRHEEVLIRMLDGSERWYQLVIKIIYDIGNYGHRPVYAIGKILDIQQQINEKEQLYKESTTDSLTGIYNRAGGFKEINHALSKQGGAIIMADLDKFKQVNDEFGHFAGDHVLIETASILKYVFHEGIVARLGGDEFLLFIQNTNKEEIALLCERALKEMHEKKYEDAKNVDVTMSMGVVFVKENASLENAMRKADELLYEAKRSGRSTYHICEETV